jgi:hypothetical protein
MAKALDSLIDFSGGEASPKLDARIDSPKYRKLLRQLQNLIPYKSGGFTRAPGTQMIAPCKLANSATHNYAVRSVPFTFSPDTTFDLEFGSGYIRFYSNGLQVSVTVADLPFWIAVNAYSPGTYVQHLGVSYINIFPVAANFPTGNSAPAADPGHWAAQSILEVYTPYNADAGSAGPQPGSIYDTDIWGLQFEQINDEVFITSPNYPPYLLTRFSDLDWTIVPAPYLTPALLDQNATDTQIASSAVNGNGVTLTATAPAWVTATYYTPGDSVTDAGVIYNCVVPHVAAAAFWSDLAAGYWVQVSIFNALQIGGTWELSYLNNSSYLEVDGVAATGFTNGNSGTIQAIGGWEVHTYGVWSSDIAVQQSLDGGSTWTTIEVLTSRSDANYDVTGTADVLSLYRFAVSNSAALVGAGATNPRVVFVLDNAFIDGLVTITGVAGPYSALANVVTQLLGTSGTQYWSEAAWSNYRGFPAAVTTFQQRMIYGGSGFEPQRIWGTQTDDIQNFDLGDQSLATDGFAFDLNAPSRGPIQTLIAQLDLFVLFSGAEWVVNSGSTNSTGQSSGAAITPTSINAVESSAWGSAQNVEPAIVGDVLMFPQRQATSLRQMLFSVYSEKYMTTDLTELADHLFGSGIAQIAYQTRFRKQSIVWVVTQAGQLCGMTYELGTEVTGWCRRTTGQGGFDPNGNALIGPFDNGFESVSVIAGKGLNDDEVWVVANRLIGGVSTRFMERVNPNNWEETFTGAPNVPFANLPDAYYVDCGMTVLSPGAALIPGLAYLNGRYVVGLADGYPFGPILVSGGTAQLPASIPATVAKVQIGLPIPYAGQPMRLDSDGAGGNFQGRVKELADRFFVRVWNSMGGSISNGTTQYPLWVSGAAYVPGNNVTSPSTQTAFQCTVAVASATDPAQDPAHWVGGATPVYMPPVAIKYVTDTANPFATPVMVTAPTDKLVPPLQNPSPDLDPIVIVQGADAAPLTVLALIAKPSISED